MEQTAQQFQYFHSVIHYPLMIEVLIMGLVGGYCVSTKILNSPIK